MKRIFLLAGMLVMLLVGVAAAAPNADPVILNAGNWYNSHPMPTSPGISCEIVFQSPRSAVMIRQAPAGTVAAPHYHNVADEVVYIVEGSAELLTNGDWVKLQPGDVHVNPRGAVHGLKVTDPKGCKFFSVFTPPQPTGGDVTPIPAGAPLQSPEGLLEATPGAGVVVSLKEWQRSPTNQNAQSPGAFSMPDYLEGDGLRGVTVTETPRSIVMLRDAGYGASHRHTQNQADEIIFVVSGSAHVSDADSSNVIGKNYIQVIPMGSEHNMRLMLGESIRFVTVFALQGKPVLEKPSFMQYIKIQ